MDDIYTDFFAASDLPKARVVELWTEVACSLGVAPGLLRPSDRFDEELRPVRGLEFDDDLIVLQHAAENRLYRLGVEEDLTKVKTVRDYVELFCRLEDGRGK